MPQPGLSTLFVRNRHLLLLTVALLLTAGISTLATLPRIEDPRITTRNATVTTPLPGASAERVESQVTRRLEERLRELAEIKTLESVSRSGISVINLELEDRVTAQDNEAIFAKVRDRLADAARELPSDAGSPVFDDMRGAVAYSLVLSFTLTPPGEAGAGLLRRTAEELGDRLRNLPGTEQVVYFGAPEEEIAVALDAEELAALGLTPAEIAGRLAAADVARPAGTVHGAGRRLPLEVSGELDSVARIRAVPLLANARDGLVTLGDVASIGRAWRDPPSEIALDQGRRAVLVAVRTVGDVRLDRWTTRATEAVEAFRATLDPGIELGVVFEQNRYTEARLGQLGSNLLAGAAVVVAVVLLTMGWRAALIVGSALPLSAAASLFGLALFGEQIHQMSIFGMIIAIGLLIDSAIVVTDAVIERLRAGASRVEAVAGAISHLAVPLFASTFTTVLGFMPVFLLPGNVGDFIGPIAIAVILALCASYVLSLTVVPALAGWLLPRDAGRRGWWRGGVHLPRLAHAYRALLGAALERPGLTLLLALLLPLAGFGAARGLGMEFFPPADRDQLELQVWLPAGSGIDETHARLADIERELHAQADLVRVTWVAGASSPPVYYNQLRTEDDNPAYARGLLTLVDAAAARAAVPVLQRALDARYPGLQIVVRAFGQGPPIKAPVALRLVGPDLDELRRLGEQVREAMHALPEISHTRASIGSGTPKLWFDADERTARLVGLSLGEIAAQFHGALDGVLGGNVLEGLDELPVRLRLAAEQRATLDEIAALRLQLPGDGQWTPALALGELRLAPEFPAITRRNGERVNEILGYLHQGALPIEVGRTLAVRLDQAGFALPAGYRLEVDGDSAKQDEAVGELLAYVPVLTLLMVATLVLAFRSFALAGLVGVVAVASIGLGLLCLAVAGFPLGFNPIIGSAGLVGVAINGSIVVLAAIRASAPADSHGPEAVIEATVGATRHIVSTTLTTVAGFMPLLLSGGDFWPPLAVVIAGGVGLSMLLSLFLAPAGYLVLERWRRAARARAGRTEALGVAVGLASPGIG